MHKKLLLTAVVVSFLAGCATVPMESAETSAKAKTFGAPPAGKAAMYVYRSGHFGSALKKDVWIDGKCIGETAPNVFFYLEVPGGVEYKLSTESEFSPNDLIVKAETGKSYFIQQYIKMGAFVHGAGLELVDEEKGRKWVEKLQLAKQGTCSQ